MAPSSRITATAAIHHPRAEEMSLLTLTAPDALILTISTGHVWLSLGTAESDQAAEIAAMERLAVLATEAAARLRVAGEDR